MKRNAFLLYLILLETMSFSKMGFSLTATRDRAKTEVAKKYKKW